MYSYKTWFHSLDMPFVKCTTVQDMENTLTHFHPHRKGHKLDRLIFYYGIDFNVFLQQSMLTKA